MVILSIYIYIYLIEILGNKLIHIFIFIYNKLVNLTGIAQTVKQKWKLQND